MNCQTVIECLQSVDIEREKSETQRRLRLVLEAEEETPTEEASAPEENQTVSDDPFEGTFKNGEEDVEWEDFWDMLELDEPEDISEPLISSAVKAMKEKGWVNSKLAETLTPLTYAVQLPNETLVKQLIEAGADVNQPDFGDEFTPLQYVVDANQLPIAKMLIDAGADVNIAGKDGRDIFLNAIVAKNFPLINLLITTVPEKTLGKIAEYDYGRLYNDVIKSHGNWNLIDTKTKKTRGTIADYLEKVYRKYSDGEEVAHAMDEPKEHTQEDAEALMGKKYTNDQFRYIMQDWGIDYPGDKDDQGVSKALSPFGLTWVKTGPGTFEIRKERRKEDKPSEEPKRKEDAKEEEPSTIVFDWGWGGDEEKPEETKPEVKKPESTIKKPIETEIPKSGKWTWMKGIPAEPMTSHELSEYLPPSIKVGAERLAAEWIRFINNFVGGDDAKKAIEKFKFALRHKGLKFEKLEDGKWKLVNIKEETPAPTGKPFTIVSGKTTSSNLLEGRTKAFEGSFIHEGKRYKWNTFFDKIEMGEELSDELYESAIYAMKKKDMLNGYINNWMTPLTFAILQDDEKFVAKLLEAGADPNQPDMNKYDGGQYPIINAAIVGNDEVGQLLMDAGANLLQKDSFGNDAMIYAIEGRKLRFVQWIATKYFHTWKPALEDVEYKKKIYGNRWRINFDGELRYIYDYLMYIA